MPLPKSFCCKKSWSLLTGSKIISTSYLIFTAAMLGGLTFIMMNESTFKCLSKMQLSDYLLVGKSLFPQGSYIEPNNLAYSSATAKNNTSSRNITKASISPKQQEINHQKNKREIKSNKNEEEFGASINGSNYSTVSSTSEKDNITTYSTNVINGNNSFVTSEPNINDKYALNDNQTTSIDLNRPSPLDDIQNSSSVSTKSITKDDISENSTIPTKVTITTYSTNMLVGNNSFVTSRSIIGDKSSSNENQTTISIHSTVQNLSDGFQTSSINVTAKVTTIHSTNISIENSSMPISSQNLTSTTLKLPITYLLNQSLEIHEATSQNEPIKLKDSSQSRKRPRKKKPTGSITNETKTDDDKDEPTTTEMTEPITFEFSVLSIDSSAGTSSTSASNEAENHLVSYLGFPMVKANVRGRTKSNDGKSIKAPPKVTKMHYAKTSSGSHENVEEDDDTALLINNILISGIALHGIYFGACLLLMIGISKRFAGFIAPWVLAEFFRQLAVLAIWVLLCYHTVNILNKDPEDAKYAIPICAAILIVIVLTFYFWLVICSFYKEVRKRHTVIPEERNDNAMDSKDISTYI